MSPSEYLMERYEAIQKFERFFETHPIVPVTAARTWYRTGSHHRFYEYSTGEKIIEQCRVLEKTVSLDDNYWLVGKGSFS